MPDWLSYVLSFYAGGGFATSVICFSVNSYLGEEDGKSHIEMSIEILLHILLWPIAMVQCIVEMHHRDPNLKQKEEEEDARKG